MTGLKSFFCSSGIICLLACSSGQSIDDSSPSDVPGPSDVEIEVCNDVVKGPDAPDTKKKDTTTADVEHPVWDMNHPWTDGRFIRDAEGRVLVLRGVNLANASKSAPFLPSWLEPGTFADIARRGFNVVRFLIFWEAVEPVEGLYDDAYLDEVEQAVKWAGNAGLYVILDMHQDVWGRKFNSDGAPVWATLDDDIPYDNEGPWWMGYAQPAVIRAFESFWKDRDKIRGKFVEMWAHVASRFADNTVVIGYDLFNEPFHGTFPTHEAFCNQGLTPLYDALISAIRQEDTRHILFVEPWIATSSGQLGCITPMERDGVVYAPHFYDPVAKLDNVYDGDSSRAAAGFEAHADTAEALGVPWFLGEWGFGAEWQGSVAYINDQADLLQAGFTGWTVWSWDHGGGFSVMTKDGTPKWSMDALTRVFPRRIVGSPLSFSASPDGNVTFEFEPWAWIDAKTEIFVPDSRYPFGFNATLSNGEFGEEPVKGGTLLMLSVPADAGPGVQRLSIEPAFPSQRFGLSSHVSTSNIDKIEQELDLNVEAGLKLLRRDFSWSHIEPQPGEFLFDGYDLVVDEAAVREIEVLGLLDYGNSWAYGTPGEDSTLDMDAFGAFAGACAGHFKGRVRYWEVWNEENIDRFWKPEPDPEAYGRLLKSAAAAIREACSDCLVVFGGLAPNPFPGPFWLWDFLKRVYEEHPDLNAHFDVLAIHPYTAVQMAAPEQEMLFGSTPQVVAEARGVMWEHGASKPVWLTEFGWPAAPDPPVGPEEKPIPNVSIEDQARYLVRGFVLGASAGVEASLWYTTSDGKGASQPSSESYFGLLQYDAEPGIDPAPVRKPSWHAAAALTSFLSGRAYLGLEAVAPGVQAHWFGKGCGGPYRMLVAWCPDCESTFEYSVVLDDDDVEATVEVWDIQGDPVLPVEVPGGWQVDLGPDPIYLTGPIVQL